MHSKKPNSAGKSEPAPQSVTDTGAQPQRKTKQALLLELIGRQEGATLDELTSTTGWQPHTARAAVTGLRKRGHDIRCKRVDGVSRYVIGTARK